MLLSASILSADFSNLKRDIELAELAGIDMVHIDVMDGVFVPNISVGPFIVETVRKLTKLPLDVHLMTVNPERYVKDFISAGSDRICFHFEATNHHHRFAENVKTYGKEVGVALNPSTPVSILEDILPFVDFVTIMSVDPGFGGQSFIKTSFRKVSSLRRMITNLALSVEIEVDGGINIENIKVLKKQGVDVAAVGSAIFNGNIQKNIKRLKETIA